MKFRFPRFSRWKPHRSIAGDDAPITDAERESWKDALLEKLNREYYDIHFYGPTLTVLADSFRRRPHPQPVGSPTSRTVIEEAVGMFVRDIKSREEYKDILVTDVAEIVPAVEAAAEEIRLLPEFKSSPGRWHHVILEARKKERGHSSGLAG